MKREWPGYQRKQEKTKQLPRAGAAVHNTNAVIAYLHRAWELKKCCLCLYKLGKNPKKIIS